MKVTLWMGPNETRNATPNGDHVIVDGACPFCEMRDERNGVQRERVFRVRGEHQRIAADDRAYEAVAICLDCEEDERRGVAGTLRAEVDTIFGIREDEAMAAEIEPRGGRIY